MLDDVPCFRQYLDRLFGFLTLHHDVIRIESGDCEDAAPSLCQWSGDRSQDARQRELQGTSTFRIRQSDSFLTSLGTALFRQTMESSSGVREIVWNVPGVQAQAGTEASGGSLQIGRTSFGKDRLRWCCITTLLRLAECVACSPCDNCEGVEQPTSKQATAIPRAIAGFDFTRLKLPTNVPDQRPPPATPGRLQKLLTNYPNRPIAWRGGGSLPRSCWTSSCVHDCR